MEDPTRPRCPRLLNALAVRPPTWPIILTEGLWSAGMGMDRWGQMRRGFPAGGVGVAGKGHGGLAVDERLQRLRPRDNLLDARQAGS